MRLFPTQVTVSDFNDAQLIKALTKDTYALSQIDLPGRRWSKKNYEGGYTSYSSVTDLHHRFTTFEKLKKIIDREVKKFAKIHHWDLDFSNPKNPPLVMTTCWTSIMPQHTYHPLHIHPLSVISGTFYLQTPPKTARLKLEDPRLDLQMAAPPRKSSCPEAFKPYVRIEPKPGRLILFESWLRHEVPPNLSRGDRLSVSFNYEWNRN